MSKPTKISQYQPFPAKCTLLHRSSNIFLPTVLSMVFVTERRHCRVRCAEQCLHQYLLGVPLHSAWLHWAEVPKLALSQKQQSHINVILLFSQANEPGQGTILIQLLAQKFDLSLPDTLCCEDMPRDLRADPEQEAGQRPPEVLCNLNYPMIL